MIRLIVASMAVCVLGQTTLGQQSPAPANQVTPTPAVAADRSAMTIAGHYRCVSEGYQGQVVIRQMTDETYRVFWSLGVAAYVGTGIRKGETLCVGYAGQGGTGVIVYQVEAGKRLTGQYCTLPGDWKLHVETLTFIGPLRSWEAGDKVLANWTQDPLWYPATITKREGDRYLVKFATGTEESISASRIAADNIKVGYAVLAKQGPQGLLMAGQVTSRNGDAVDVQLPTGQKIQVQLADISVLTIGEG